MLQPVHKSREVAKSSEVLLERELNAGRWML
jgi:hypothetical protein